MAADAEATSPRIAIFASTSGHSGVDRAMSHLVPELLSRGYQVDLLKVRRHGPNLDIRNPRFRCIDLRSAHTYPSLPAVVRYLRRYRPAVFLADKDRVNRTALLAKALARVDSRLVLSSGTTISIDLAHRGRFERWLQRTSMGKLYPLADAVIVTSEGVAEDTAHYTGLDRRVITVVPSPVVPDDALEERPTPPDHPWFVADAPPLILAAGELGSRKGFDVLIRAFARLRAERQARLMILGKGRQRDALLSLGEELGVASDLDLPGFVPDPMRYMAHASVFAMTSRWEGLGFVLIEALAAGTPAVATDCPSGPREILDNGRYGALVPVDDDAALAEALAKTLDNPLPPQILREAAHPYTISAATDAYLDVFKLPRRLLDRA